MASTLGLWSRPASADPHTVCVEYDHAGNFFDASPLPFDGEERGEDFGRNDGDFPALRHVARISTVEAQPALLYGWDVLDENGCAIVDLPPVDPPDIAVALAPWTWFQETALMQVGYHCGREEGCQSRIETTVAAPSAGGTTTVTAEVHPNVVEGSRAIWGAAHTEERLYSSTPTPGDESLLALATVYVAVDDDDVSFSTIEGIDPTADTIAVEEMLVAYPDGTRIFYVDRGFPSSSLGIIVNTPYYVRNQGPQAISLHTTEGDAIADVNRVDLDLSMIGTHPSDEHPAVAFETDLVDDAADTITAVDAHGLVDGTGVVYVSGGTDALGLTTGSRYYARVVDPATFDLHATEAAALNPLSTPIDLTTGTGETHEVRKPLTHRFEREFFSFGTSANPLVGGHLGFTVTLPSDQKKYTLAHEYAHVLTLWSEPAFDPTTVDYSFNPADPTMEGDPLNHSFGSREWQSAASVEGVANFTMTFAYHALEAPGTFGTQVIVVDVGDPTQAPGLVLLPDLFLVCSDSTMPPPCIDGVSNERDWPGALVNFFYSASTPSYGTILSMWPEAILTAGPGGWPPNGENNAFWTNFQVASGNVLSGAEQTDWAAAAAGHRIDR